MTNWTKRSLDSLHFFISLSTFVCNVEPREFHVKLRKGRSPLGVFYIAKTRLLVECVYSGIQHNDCRSLGYNRTSGVCHLYPSDMAGTPTKEEAFWFGNLRKSPTSREKEISDQLSSQHGRGVVLKRRKHMSWRDADRECYDGNKRIYRIYNENDQALAVKLLNGSGLEYVAIGALRFNLKWVTRDKDRLLFSDWSHKNPRFLDSFATLSMKSGYKWESIGFGYLIDGVLCENYEHNVCYT